MWEAPLYLWPSDVAFRQSRVSGVRRFGWPTWSTRQASSERFDRPTRSRFQRHRLPLGEKLGHETPSLSELSVAQLIPNGRLLDLRVCRYAITQKALRIDEARP